jgi:hypothetical protein
MQSSVRSHPALAEAEARERERTSPYEERAQVRILATPTTKMKRSATIIKAAFDDIILSFPVSQQYPHVQLFTAEVHIYTEREATLCQSYRRHFTHFQGMHLQTSP